MMKQTKYIVYEASVEIHYNGRHSRPGLKEYVLCDAESPVMVADFSDRTEALEYMHKMFPVARIHDGMGNAVKYVLVEGMYVEEEDQILDEDGNVTDVTYVSILETSRFPDDWVFDPEDEHYYKLD